MDFTSSVSVHPTDTSIQSISVSSSSTFTPATTPIVHVPPPTSGTQAKAHINLDSDGNIDSVSIDEPGSGYDVSNPPTISIINGYTPTTNLSIEQSIAKVHSSEVHTGSLYVSGEIIAPSLSNDLTDIQADITSLEGRVADLESVDNTTDERLDDHEARLSIAEADIDDLQTLTESHTETLSSHDSRITSAETQISLLGQASPFKTIVMPPETSVYADGSAPAIVPSAKRSSSPQGWYFKNSGPPNKINWYLPPNVNMKYQDILSVKCGVFLMNKVSPPFFTIYTKPKASGNGASWYHSRHTYLIQDTSSLVNNTSYTFGFKLSDLGSEEPIYNSTFKSLTKDSFSSVGTISPTDEILFFAFSTDSSTASGNAEFILHSIQLQTPTETTDFAFHSLTNTYQDTINTTQNTNIENLQTLTQSHTSTLNSYENRITDTEFITTKFSVDQNQLVPQLPIISYHLGFGSTDDYLKFTKDPDNSNQFLFGHNDDLMNASKKLIVKMPIQTNKGLLVADGNGNNVHTLSGDFEGVFKIDDRAVLNELDDHATDINTINESITDHETRIGNIEPITQQFENMGDWMECKKSFYCNGTGADYLGFIHYITEADNQVSEIDVNFTIWKDGKKASFELWNGVKGPIAQEWYDNFKWWFRDGDVQIHEGLEVWKNCLIKGDLEVQGAITYQGETLRKKKYFEFNTTCINATGFSQSFTLPEPLLYNSSIKPFATCCNISQNMGYFPMSVILTFNENTITGCSVFSFGSNTNDADLMIAIEYV